MSFRKLYDVTVQIQGEGFSQRVYRIEAMSKLQAQALARAAYLELVEVAEPKELTEG